MTQLTTDVVRHIASLARLRLTDAEAEQFAPELTSILTYIDKLKEVDTENVEPTTQVAQITSGAERSRGVTGLHNRFREDKIRTDTPSAEEMLASSPLPIIEQQIVTPSAHGER